MLLRIKKPNKLAFDACRILCLFINSFRDFDKKWPNEAFTSWVTVHHFLVASPSTHKILKEIQSLKRMFMKPITKISADLKKDLT